MAQSANGLWVSQIARHLMDAEEGILTGKRYLIHDRDPLFTAEFLSMIADAGVESVKLPPRPPGVLQFGSQCKENESTKALAFWAYGLNRCVPVTLMHPPRLAVLPLTTVNESSPG